MSQGSTRLSFNVRSMMKREWRVLFIAILILLLISNFLTFKFASTPYSNGLHHDITAQEPLKTNPQTDKGTSPKLPTETSAKPLARPSFPAAYQQEVEVESGWCQDRFSTKYLTDLAKSQQQYCEAASAGGSLYCHHISVGGDVPADAFCVSSPAVFNKDLAKFVLKCNKKGDVQPSLESLPSYWYETGPRLLMKSYMDLSPDAKGASTNTERKFSILVKREDAVDNLWHVLMQIQSVLLTLDAMSVSFDADGKPLYTAEDIKNTQIVITDKIPDQFFMNLWEMIGGRPVRRLSDLEAGGSERIIIPLAGKSNPMWQGDWSPHLCHRSDLLQVFTTRILRHQGLTPSHRRDNDRPLVLTWIDRRRKRVLLDQDRHMAKVRSQFPGIQVRIVDFAGLSLTEQLRAVQETDILAGVHGAGLTHGMFLAPGSTAVEIQIPQMNFRGFRNMAHLKDVQYFSVHADALDGSADWHTANVTLAEDKFVALIDAAIKAMGQSGLRTDDVA